MGEQILLHWTRAGAFCYSVPGGTFVVHDGRVLAVALPDSYQSAETHFRKPLTERGVKVFDYPANQEEALKILET